MTRAKRFLRQVRRALARQYRCPASRSDWGQPTIRCDLDWRHGGLHQCRDAEGFWVWASGAWNAVHVKNGDVS